MPNNTQFIKDRTEGLAPRHRLQPARKTGSRPVKDEGVHPFRTLGWMSLGLGITALAAPRSLSRLIGVRDDHGALVRMIGVREMTSGIGIVTQRRPVAWILSRIAGDFFDLALLGTAFSKRHADRGRLVAAAAAVAGITLIDIHFARQLSRNAGNHAERSTAITINGSPELVYRFWRDFQNLPRFMSHLKSVQVIDQKHSHWVAAGPAGMMVEWDAEITADQPNELIAWRSLPGAQVHNTGEVRFREAPGGRGTEVHVRIRYAPPAGSVGIAIAKLFGEEPGQQLKGDLYRFKQVMETGEVLHSDASIHRGRHAAQPPHRQTRTAGNHRRPQSPPEEEL